MKVISISSEKGGVGKSSSTIEIATILKSIGKRVLVIDLDENCSLSTNIGANLNTEKTIYEVLHTTVNVFDAIQHLELFDILVGSKSLSRVVKEFCLNPDSEDEYLIDDICHVILKDEYDYILIDNAPSKSLLLTMTYIACDYVLIPTVCDESSINMAKETINDINKLTNGRKALSKAKVIGFILNMYRRSTMYDVAKIWLDEIAESLNVPVYKINYAIKVSEVKTEHTALSKIQKGSPVSRAFYEIAEDIINLSKE